MADLIWNTGGSLKKIRNFLEDKMEIVCELLETDMKEKASGHQGLELKAFDLGNYVNSFDHRVISDDTMVTGIVFNTAEYSPFIEFGTGEHAENGQGRQGGWYYIDPKTGEYRFTKGMKPRPIMRTSLIENKQTLKEFLEAE